MTKVTAEMTTGLAWISSVPILSFDGSKVPDKTLINFSDRDTVGDGGGGPLRFLKGSTATANGVTIYAVTSGRLVREGWSVFGVDVRWAGAKGDGITDDTAAIQAAINYVQENMTLNVSDSPYIGPQVLYFPDGYFKTTSTLTITKAISLIGSKSAEFSTGARIFSTTSGDLFNFNPAGGGLSFSIERLTMFSTVSGTGHLVNVVAGSPGYNSWRIKDCCFQSPQQMAIRATGDDIQIIGNTFDVSGYSGNCIQLGSNTAGDKASNVRIINNDFFNIVTHCILHYNAQNVTVQGNTVSQPNSSMTSVAFYDAYDSTPTLVDGITVTGNTMYGIRRALAVNTGSNITFSGNTVFNGGIGSGETYSCLMMSGTISEITITGNTFSGSWGGKYAYDDTTATGVTNLVLTGNTFRFNGATVPILATANSHGVIEANIFAGTSSVNASVSEKRSTSGAPISPGLIGSGATYTYTINVQSARVGDKVEFWSPVGSWPVPIGIEIVAYVASTGVVNIDLRNGAAIGLTPAGFDISYVVSRGAL